MTYSSKIEKIGFYSTLAGAGTDMGYGYASVNLIEAWQRKEIPVWWCDEEAPIAFSFIQPHWYEFTNKDRVNIGYTPWESTKVPEPWLWYMNNMDEVWTTSNACKEWYEQAGVSVPIRVLHHGINAEHWPLERRQRRSGEPFRWLHIGGESKRKGARTVYEAFTTLFKDNDDVILVLKGDIDWEPQESNVYVIRERLLQADLTKLVLKCHAMCYPTNGEGFGLIPFQAAATGMPTLVTDWSGPKDYMKYCLPIRVQELVEPNYEPHEGLWAEPSMDDILEKMWDITQEKSDFFFEEAHVKGSNLQRNWSWDSMADKSLKWMGQLLESR